MRPSNSVTKDELAKMLTASPGNKYRNQKTVVDGITFDSAKEARRYSHLILLERSGRISNLQRQVRYQLVVNHMKICTYVADFVYTERGSIVVEDAKGVRTREYILKRKLMEALLGIVIKET